MKHLKDFKISIGNLTIGDKWEIGSTKIYNDDGIVVEEGKSIRTIYTINGEKNYTEWVYCLDDYVEKASELINKYIKKYVSNEDIERKEVTEEETIPSFLAKLKKVDVSKEGVDRYITDTLSLDHHLKEESIIIANMNGKVLENLQGDNYTVNYLKKFIKEEEKDPGEINNFLLQQGYTEVSKKIDDGIEFWIYKNPKKEKFVLHSEENKFFGIVDKNNDILVSLEGNKYNIEEIRKSFD